MDKFRPKLVLLFGGSAVHSFVGTSWGSSDVNKIGRWRGWVIPDRNAKAWLCPMYHPSFILRRDSEEVRTVWYRDLERALSYVDTPFPVSEDERKRIRIVKSESDVETILGRIRQGEEGKWICFDYETTGLKPQGDQHKIICVSVATAESTYAFMLPESPTALEQLRRVLGSARIGKAAHNMGFEDTWTNVRLGD